MDERQRQIVLFVGFMVLMAVAAVFIATTGDASGASLNFDFPEIPLLDEAVDGWRNAINDTQNAGEVVG